ncbi:glycerophosphodiester phosphodiesterase family protein [Streptomyces sp. NPDC005963]|uniref:glycerophosphodiester phosphodiesterase n=1 Tax=Streptomyces sp. NPDC005963 TaxID=3156721 RepID=UPI00340A0603
MFSRHATATALTLLGISASFVFAPLAQADQGTERPGAVASSDGGPTVIAHRGASGYAPENTLAAIDLADDMGFDWVENDVQRTRDGQLVVIHDETLARTTDVEQRFPDRAPWRVRDFTAAEIGTLDAGSWFGQKWTHARVPTLRQYLDRVDSNGQKLLLEIKRPELYPGIEKDTLRVLRQEGWLDRSHVRSRLVMQNFSADSVKTVHRLRPDVITGFLGTPPVAELPSYAAFTDQINPAASSVTADYVASVQRLKGPHGARLQVNTWTVNDAATAARMSGFGVDGIITDRPDVVRDAVS